MNAIKDSFRNAGVVLGIVGVLAILLVSYRGCRLAGDAVSMDPSVSRQKRIEKKVDEMGIKLDQLIDLGKKWE